MIKIYQQRENSAPGSTTEDRRIKSIVNPPGAGKSTRAIPTSVRATPFSIRTIRSSLFIKANPPYQGGKMENS
jgi:hypothetical protein